MTYHLCRPRTVWLRSVRFCPTCKKRRRFIGMEQLWFGCIWTCCACGDAWGDGERLTRPFAPRWREREAARARRHWADAPPRAEANAELRSMYHELLP